MIAWMRLVRGGAVCLALVVAVPARPQQAPIERAPSASILSVYTPPACVPGVPFADVTCTTGFDPWIEQFGLDGITAGCGGGLYCPSNPVTRDQMAVFIEKAMRGTSNWPPHTVLVFHHPAAEANSDVNSGTELLSLVAGIPASGSEAPSATNPWLIKVGPGIFDLGSGSLTLPGYTALEGAGQDITTITAPGSGSIFQGATVIPGDHARLSRLTINNSGGNYVSVAAFLPTSASRVVFEHVTLTVSGADPSMGQEMCLITMDQASFSLLDCDLRASGGFYVYGVWAYGSHPDESRLDGVRIDVSLSGLNGAGWGVSSLTPLVITDSLVRVSGGASQFGVLMAGMGSTLDLRGSEVYVSGGNGTGVSIGIDSARLLGDLIISDFYGVVTGADSSADISSCNITGATYWLYNGSGFTVTVGASKLVGTTLNIGGTVNCFGNYTGTAFLPNTCP